MFRSMKIHGRLIPGREVPAIVWGYRKAAVLRTWTVTKDSSSGQAVWTLSGQVAEANTVQLRQPGLLFSAPRLRGFWCWPLLEPPRISNWVLTARLGPPEQ